MQLHRNLEELGRAMRRKDAPERQPQSEPTLAKIRVEYRELPVVHDEVGVPVVPEYQPELNRATESARMRLGNERFEGAWSEGWSLDVPQAIEIVSRW